MHYACFKNIYSFESEVWRFSNGRLVVFLPHHSPSQYAASSLVNTAWTYLTLLSSFFWSVTLFYKDLTTFRGFLSILSSGVLNEEWCQSTGLCLFTVKGLVVVDSISTWSRLSNYYIITLHHSPEERRRLFYRNESLKSHALTLSDARRQSVLWLWHFREGSGCYLCVSEDFDVVS